MFRRFLGDSRGNFALQVFGAPVAHVVRPRDPVAAGPVEVDHRVEIHGDHPGKVRVGDLDRVVDPVVERIRTRGAERRLVGVEDHLARIGADGVDRDLPAGVVARPMASITSEFTGLTDTFSLADYDVVYFQANANWSAGDMPSSGQSSLVAFVNGGGSITSEWVMWLARIGTRFVVLDIPPSAPGVPTPPP